MAARFQAFLLHEIDARHFAWSVLAMAPDLVLYGCTGSLLWFHGALVSICLLIVQTRLAPSLALLGIHAITMAALTSLFFLAIPYPWAFALVAAATGFLTYGITRWDKRLFSFGNWNFIPPLYIACEMASNATGPNRLTSLVELLQVWPLSIASVALVLRPPLFARADAFGWRRWFGLSPDAKPIASALITRAASARATAVFLATVLMDWKSADHGEWGIWSAASVVNPDSADAITKFRDRALGAIGGVGCGLLLGPFLPHSQFLYVLVVLGTFLTLTVIKRYPAAFTTRCFLITLAAYAAALGMEAGRDRALNVVLGSFIGLVITLIFHALTKRLKLTHSFHRPPSDSLP